MTRHFLPAAPDETVIAIGFYLGEGEGPPSVETACVDWHRVIAWRIEDDEVDGVVAYPVFIDPNLDRDDSILFHVMPDARLMSVGDIVVDDEEAAKRLAVEHALEALERRRSKPAA